MSEAEWLACTDSTPMLEFLRRKASDRKLRLVACGYCRSIWHLMTDPRSRMAVEIAERVADGRLGRMELEQASEAATHAWREHLDIGSAAASQASFVKGLNHRTWLEWSASNTIDSVESEARRTGQGPQVTLLHDIFGNPFHAVAVEPSWLAWNDGTIPKLAQSIYDKRAFDRLPVLADALEIAGCTNTDILTHCRSEWPHVRGCWAVDLILGKE